MKLLKPLLLILIVTFLLGCDSVMHMISNTSETLSKDHSFFESNYDHLVKNNQQAKK